MKRNTDAKRMGLACLVAVSVVIAAMACQSSKKMSELNTSTVKNFDLQRYLGQWYEIARFDHRFERGLQGVTAIYSLSNDGKIKVLNQGYKKGLNGKPNTAKGKAKTTEEPGKLKVAFFLFFYGDYYVLELDDDYQWALIGSSSDNYLWILSRTPQLEESTKNKAGDIQKNVNDKVEQVTQTVDGIKIQVNETKTSIDEKIQQFDEAGKKVDEAQKAIGEANKAVQNLAQ